MYKMDDYNTQPEEELRQQIEEAKQAGDYDAIRELMQELIKLQKDAPQVEMSDEELANAGVDMAILQKERELRDRINQANQDGDFLESKQLMRELRQLQKLQPAQVGVKLA